MKEHTVEELKAAAQRTANVYARIANKRFGCTLPVPMPIEWDIELTSMSLAKAAGVAWRTQKRIGINTMVMIEDPVALLNDTIPHEIAHLIEGEKFPHSEYTAHGPMWKEVMSKLGREPHKFHSVNTARAVERFKQHKALKKKAKVK